MGRKGRKCKGAVRTQHASQTGFRFVRRATARRMTHVNPAAAGDAPGPARTGAERMGKDKLPFEMGKPEAEKAWDKDQGKTAAAALSQGVAKVAGKSGKLEAVSAVKSGKRGIRLTVVVNSLTWDAGSGGLSTKVSIQGEVLPKEGMKIMQSGAASVTGVTEKDLKAGIDDLMGALADDLGGKVRKAMEKLADD